MLKKKMMMQKQTMQMQKQGRLPQNYSEESEKVEKKEGEKDGTFDALRTMKPEGQKDDPRSMPAKINLAKNKLRAMGLKMSYDMKGEMTEGLSVDSAMMKIVSWITIEWSPEEKKAAYKKPMGNVSN